MCRQTTCRTCQKPTWAGCGAHVEQVLGHIPKAERCQGHTRTPNPKTAKLSTPADSSKRSLLQRLRRSSQK
jgi:hypothetical protein